MSNLFKNALIALIFIIFLVSILDCKRDKEEPVITLEGEKTVKLALNASYVEPGYTASDDKDGDITRKVIVSDTIIPDTVGTYIIQYKVSDEKGRDAVAERKII